MSIHLGKWVVGVKELFTRFSNKQSLELEVHRVTFPFPKKILVPLLYDVYLTLDLIKTVLQQYESWGFCIYDLYLCITEVWNMWSLYKEQPYLWVARMSSGICFRLKLNLWVITTLPKSYATPAPKIEDIWDQTLVFSVDNSDLINWCTCTTHPLGFCIVRWTYMAFVLSYVSIYFFLTILPFWILRFSGVVKSKRSIWRLRTITDFFWSIINLIMVFFTTMFSVILFFAV